jgi:hypothetical protein
MCLMPRKQAKEPTEAQRFEALAKRLMAVPKAELDKARAKDAAKRGKKSA